MTATPPWITCAKLKGGCGETTSVIHSAQAFSPAGRAPPPDSDQQGAVDATLLGPEGAA